MGNVDLVVDGDRPVVLSGEHRRLVDVLEAVTGYLESQGRAMAGLIIDGERVGVTDLTEDLALRPVESMERVEVHSETLVKLARDTLREMRAVLPELPVVCHQLAEVFGGESPGEGYGLFEQLAVIWAELKAQQNQVAEALGAPLGEMTVKGRRLEEYHAELNQYLDDAEQALADRDAVALGDLLEYELAPRAEFELMIVDVLGEALAQVP